MPDPPDEQYAPDEQWPEDEPRPVEHDPQGLDLARQIARAVQASSAGVRRPRRRRRQPREDPQSSGAHPDGRDPKLLGEALDGLFDELGWRTEVNVHLILGRWGEIVGSTIADHSQPQHYADRVLTVRAESTAWASALRLQAAQIVARLNEALGDGSVERIVILGPDVPSWKHGRRSVRGRGPRDTYG